MNSVESGPWRVEKPLSELVIDERNVLPIVQNHLVEENSLEQHGKTFALCWFYGEKKSIDVLVLF